MTALATTPRPRADAAAGPPLDHETRERVVLSVLHWARRCAARYCLKVRRGDLVDELEAALVALLWEKSADYDPSRGRPTTWAAMVALTHLPREFHRIAHAATVPLRAHEDLARLVRRQADGAATEGDRRTARLLALAMRRPLCVGGTFVIDAEGEEAVFDLPDPRAGDAGDDVAAADRAAALRAAVGRLPDRERAFLVLRFGLDDGVPMTLVQIARRMGCSREWPRQLEGIALRRLRALLGGEGEGEGGAE